MLDDSVVAYFASGEGPERERRVMWSRQLTQPTDSGFLCQQRSEREELIDLEVVTADNLYGALQAARIEVHMPEFASMGNVVIDTNGDGQASFYFSHGSSHTTMVIE